MTAGASSPPGYCLTASSDLTDSALPGRKETVSFFCASSNLPENSPPTIAVMTKKTAATTNLRALSRGKSEESGHALPTVRSGVRWDLYSSSAASSSGSVTGRWQAKRSHT